MKFSDISIFQELLDVFTFRSQNFHYKFYFAGNVLRRIPNKFEGTFIFVRRRGVCLSYCITDHESVLFTFRRTEIFSSPQSKNFRRKNYFFKSVRNALKHVLRKFKRVFTFGKREGGISLSYHYYF